MPGNYIEDKYLPGPFWGWIILILFSVSVLGFGMWLMMAVPDVPRQWNFGTYPDTPAASVYSTKQPPADVPVYRVVPELPESSPLSRIRTQAPTAGTQEQPPGGPSRWRPPRKDQPRSESEMPQRAGGK